MTIKRNTTEKRMLNSANKWADEINMEVTMHGKYFILHPSGATSIEDIVGIFTKFEDLREEINEISKFGGEQSDS